MVDAWSIFINGEVGSELHAGASNVSFVAQILVDAVQVSEWGVFGFDPARQLVVIKGMSTRVYDLKLSFFIEVERFVGCEFYWWLKLCSSRLTHS